MKHTIYADLDTMVFEGREKNYGAFQMRNKSNRILSRAMMIAMLLFLSLTGLPKVIKWIIPANVTAPEDVVSDAMIDVELPPLAREDKVEEPPLPPEIEKAKPEPPAAVKTIVFSVIEPSDTEDPDATILDMDSALVDTVLLGNTAVDGKGTDGTDIPWDDLLPKNGGGDGPLETKVLPDPKHTDFFVGEEPRPVNMEEFKKSVGYPAMAVEATIEGKVIVRVLVDELGQYKKHIVLKDPHPILTSAVSKKLNTLRFTPGIQGNQPVKVWITIPVDFVLND